MRRLHINEPLHQGQLPEYFKNVWNQQQQQQQGDLENCGKLQRERHRKEVAGNCNDNSVAKEDDSFQVDLRVHGVSHDVIYEDKERMTPKQTIVDKLQDGYRTKFIINDLGKKGISNVFSEASRRTITELSNIALYDLGEQSEQLSVLRAYDIPKKEQFTACVVSV